MSQLTSTRNIWLLIFLNLFWSVTAFIYDWSQLVEIPIWSLPFIVICPLYPLLLMGIWGCILKGIRPSRFVFALTTMGGTVYGILALFFYPFVIAIEGFSWSALGQIAWVAVYAAQSIWLLHAYSLTRVPAYLATIWLLISFLVLYATKSYGYLGIDILPASLQNILFIAAITSLILIVKISLTSDK